MSARRFFRDVADLYIDGFRHMTVGKTLWVVILIKLFLIFFVLRLFFFPDFLSSKVRHGDKAAYVAGEMLTCPVQDNDGNP